MSPFIPRCNDGSQCQIKELTNNSGIKILIVKSGENYQTYSILLRHAFNVVQNVHFHSSTSFRKQKFVNLPYKHIYFIL